MSITKQQIILNYLNKYGNLFYIFADPNNDRKRLDDEIELNKTIDDVRSGKYKYNTPMLHYINNCIQTVRDIEDSQEEAIDKRDILWKDTDVIHEDDVPLN